jgi:hypothetical protein
VKAGEFGNQDVLTNSQYSAAATATNAFTLDIPSADNDCEVVSLPSNVLQYVQDTNVVQFRLKGTTTASFAANTLFLWGAEDGNYGYAPSLIVTYL